MDVEKIVREYITSGRTRMMQLATSVDDQPWICTVYYAVDKDLNLYWMSTPVRRHSKEISKSPKVAAAIAYDQQPPRRDHRGVTIEGVAEELKGGQALKAISLYAKQLGSSKDWVAAVKLLKDPHRIYRLTPKLFVLFDDVNFPKDSRKEWIPQN